MEKIEARNAMSLLEGSGMTLEDAVRIALQAKQVPKRATIEEVCFNFLKSRKEKRIRPSTAAWYYTRIMALYNAGRNAQFDSVERDDLIKLAAAETRSEATRASYYRAWRSLWSWAKDQEPPLCSKDPTRGLIVSPHASTHTVQFMSVDDVRKCLAGCAPKFRPAAALLFFAGLRPQELWGNGKLPMRWANIDVEERIVRVDAEQAKTRRPRILEGLPPTLWAWIGDERRNPDDPICPGQSQWLIRHLQLVGGYRKKGENRGPTKVLRPWIHDATRHSFATYAVALTNDPGKVSLWLGHNSNVMLHRHYRGLARKADAAAYFAITPE